MVMPVPALSSRRTDRGQGLAEYALILALIAIVSILAITFLGTQISDILTIVGTFPCPSCHPCLPCLLLFSHHDSSRRVSVNLTGRAD